MGKEGFYGCGTRRQNIGLIGYGNIGHQTANLAQALGMKVLAYDPYVTSQNGVKLVTLDELLAQSDYISLHLPKTEKSPI